VDQFFDPCPDPGNPLVKFPECHLACDRLTMACQTHEHVILYGDYDCDGVVSITLMRDALLARGLLPNRIHCVTPHRLYDGYGLKWTLVQENLRRIEEDHGEPANLLVCLDCGTTAAREVECALAEDLEIIVVDHHEPDPDVHLPEDTRFLHINPKFWLSGPNAKEARKLGNMCAAGLAFLLVEAFVLGSGGLGAWSRERALLLAGLATLVDVVPLLGINRALLKCSLALANQPDKLALVPGLADLRDRVGPDENEVVNEDTYGYLWGPCVNAPGRMDRAKPALELLAAPNIAEARFWGCRCTELNTLRKATELTIQELAEREARFQVWRQDPKVLLLCQPHWHPGVVGIVAADIREAYQRPAVLCSMHPDGGWKGSGRSVEECHMGRLFHSAGRERLAAGGGHEMAGGLSFSEENREKLGKFLDDGCGLDRAHMVPVVEVVAPASVLTAGEWGEVFAQLAPFGRGNLCPGLYVEAAELMGVRPRTKLSRHVKLEYQADKAAISPEQRAAMGLSAKRGRAREQDRPEPTVWAYVGIFNDLITQRALFALWTDLDAAELGWHVSEFMEARRSRTDFRPPCLFRLQLQVRAHVPAKQWLDVKLGERPGWEYGFEVVRCIELAPGAARRMPVAYWRKSQERWRGHIPRQVPCAHAAQLELMPD
jgi:single-stranded-DNA-specific exonuclease